MRIAPTARRTPRLVIVAALALLTATAALSSGCGGDDGDDDNQQPSPSAGAEAREYVGTVEGVTSAPPARRGQYFVAVTFDEAGKVVAYVCDGTGTGAQLFEGKATGGKLDLTSVTGDARLTGTVTDGAVTGEVTIGGKQLAYTTERAKGIGGLYTVERQAGAETAAGRSVSGNTIGTEGTPPNATLTVTTADGKQSVDISKDLSPRPVYSEVRAILLDNGHRRGQKTVKATQSGSTNFTCPYLFG
jgi:hypothetical protein